MKPAERLPIDVARRIPFKEVVIYPKVNNQDALFKEFFHQKKTKHLSAYLFFIRFNTANYRRQRTGKIARLSLKLREIQSEAYFRRKQISFQIINESKKIKN